MSICDWAASLKSLTCFSQPTGSTYDDLGIRCPGSEFGTPCTHPIAEYPSDYAPRMMGQSVILQASRRIVAGCRTILERNNLTANEIQWIVPHQANANLLAQVARALGFAARDERVISVLEDSGNTSSASIGIALDTLRRSGRIKSGRLLTSAGVCRGLHVGRCAVPGDRISSASRRPAFRLWW